MGRAERRRLQVALLVCTSLSGPPPMLLLCCYEFGALGVGSASWWDPWDRLCHCASSQENSEVSRRVALLSPLCPADECFEALPTSCPARLGCSPTLPGHQCWLGTFSIFCPL